MILCLSVMMMIVTLDATACHHLVVLTVNAPQNNPQTRDLIVLVTLAMVSVVLMVLVDFPLVLIHLHLIPVTLRLVEMNVMTRTVKMVNVLTGLTRLKALHAMVMMVNVMAVELVWTRPPPRTVLLPIARVLHCARQSLELVVPLETVSTMPMLLTAQIVVPSPMESKSNARLVNASTVSSMMIVMMDSSVMVWRRATLLPTRVRLEPLLVQADLVSKLMTSVSMMPLNPTPIRLPILIPTRTRTQTQTQIQNQIQIRLLTRLLTLHRLVVMKAAMVQTLRFGKMTTLSCMLPLLVGCAFFSWVSVPSVEVEATISMGDHMDEVHPAPADIRHPQVTSVDLVLAHTLARPLVEPPSLGSEALMQVAPSLDRQEARVVLLATLAGSSMVWPLPLDLALAPRVP